MVKLLKPRRLTIWIACFAILLNALAPSISYAMYAMHSASSPSGTPPILMEVCTANGMKMVEMVDDAVEKTSDSALDTNGDHKKPVAASAHCPFCLPHYGALFLLPAAATSFALPAQQGLMPTLFYQSPQPLFSWVVAHPRGPPAAS